MTAMRASPRSAVNPVSIITSAMFCALLAAAPAASADTTAQSLPFMQTWTNTNLITTDDDWSGVPGIVGHRGDDLTVVTGTDPQTILADGTTTPLDVNANRTDPSTFATGGIAEFEILDPTVALQGSGTADAPFLLISLSTLGFSAINVSYTLRDLDGSIDNAVQQFALHYRLGASGSFTNVAAGYVADATLGGSAVLVTPVSAFLPADAANAALLQVRVMTTNAAGNDEWVGVDNILVAGVNVIPEPEVYAMMLAGLGLLGFTVRRRRSMLAAR